MNHTGTTFASHYLSTQIRYDTQARFPNKTSNTKLIDRSYHLINGVDPDRPERLTAKQMAEIDQSTQVKALKQLRAAGATSRQYRDITSMISSLKKSLANKSLKKIQTDYDEETPVRHIERNMKGLLSAPLPTKIPISYAFEERERIAAILQGTSDPSKYPEVRYAFIDNVASLCPRYEEPHSRPARQPTVTPLPAASQNSDSPPMHCQPGQCLFCKCYTALPKAKQNAMHQNLSRHAGCCWIKHYKHAAVPCPHKDCSPLVLRNLREFKNHAQEIHRMYLAGHARPASERQASRAIW